MSQPPDEPLPLAERLPDYAAVFAAGLVAAAAVGVVVGLVFPVGVPAAVGYVVALLGVILMLAGGAAGGGYTDLGIGALGTMVGGRRTDRDEGPGAGETPSAEERLRRGLRPEANPRAFWQVVAGLLYVAVGLGVLALVT